MVLFSDSLLNHLLLFALHSPFHIHQEGRVSYKMISESYPSIYFINLVKR